MLHPRFARISLKLLCFASLYIFLASESLSAAAPAEKPKPEELKPAAIRVLDAEGRVLLSRESLPMAVAQFRPLTPLDQPPPAIMTESAAKDLLAKPGDALAQGAEELREFHYPLPTGDPLDQLEALIRIRKMAEGARMTMVGNVTGPSRDELRPGEHLNPAAPLELAIQIFAGADGKLPDTFFVDGTREALAIEPKPFMRHARSWSFEGKKGFRAMLARSGPTDWSVSRLGNSIFLRAALQANPRETAGLGSFVTYLGAGPDDSPPEISPLAVDKSQTPARDFIEGWVRVYASGANPLSLSELAVIAEVALPPKPDGGISIKRLPCFFWESRGAEGEFRFRFAPPAEGVYGVRIVVVTGTGQANGDALEVRAGPPASPGFVRVRKGERQLRLDDNSVFVPMGIELPCAQSASSPSAPWAARKMLDAEECRRFFVELARNGGNTARICLSTSILPLDQQPAGAFDPDVANVLDEIFKAAQVRGIYLVVGLENARDISKDSVHHPYFREMKGPLAATPEFFHDAACKRLFQNRLAYMAARYSAYRSILAWDILDSVDRSWPALEQDPEDPKLKPMEADLARRAHRDVEDWTEEMALHIHGVDQHDHPVCISSAANPSKPWLGLEKVEHLDWVIHSPGPVSNSKEPKEAKDANEHDVVALISAWAVASRQPGRIAQPYMLDRCKAAPESELARHDVLFASLASGMSGAPLIAAKEPGELSARKDFAAALVFGSGLAAISDAQKKEELHSLVEDLPLPGTTKALKMLGRAGRRGIVAWISERASASKQKEDESREIDVKLPGVMEGNYGVYWLDTHTGGIIRQDSYQAPPKKVDRDEEPFSVKSPSFAHDIALIITLQK